MCRVKDGGLRSANPPYELLPHQRGFNRERANQCKRADMMKEGEERGHCPVKDAIS
jgi:hypothetical protein